MTDLAQLTREVIKFRDDRDWSQFHNPKDVALSLVLEATELLEIFQWQEGNAIREAAVKRKSELADEMADVLYWILLMAHDLEVDLPSALRSKLDSNAAKYPVSKAKGSNKKYKDL